MVGAFFFLRWCTLKNQIRVRLRRLRQPKYLVGGVVGLLYFYWVFLRGALGRGANPFSEVGRSEVMTPEVRWMVEGVVALMLFVWMVVVWVLPSRRGALDFSEAEIQFLFPAPVSRRALVHYKLLSWQAGLLFTSLILCLVSGRLWRGGGAWMPVLGWWLGLFLLQLHALGVSFARSWLLDRGVGDGRRRWVGLLGFVGVLVATLYWGWSHVLPLPAVQGWEPEVLGPWAMGILESPPLSWVLVPLRSVARLALTRSPAEYLAAMPVVLALVAVHYQWVLRANVAFEEAAVEAARALAERQAAAKAGVLTPRPAARRTSRVTLFELNPSGPAFVAIAWKNLAAAVTGFRARTLVRVLALLVPLVAVGSAVGRDAPWAIVVVSMAGAAFAAAVLIGPGAARMDFRHELQGGAEWIRSLPLTGREMVWGELLTPWVLLVVIQGVALGVGVAFTPTDWLGSGWEGWGKRLGVVIAGMSMGPSLALVGLTLHNLAVLAFPAWVLMAPGQGRGGFEMMGQQIIVFVGQGVVLVLALVVPGALGALTFGVMAWAFGPWVALVPGAIVAGGVLLGEGFLIAEGMARLWAGLDMSQERAG